MRTCVLLTLVCIVAGAFSDTGLSISEGSAIPRLSYHLLATHTPGSTESTLRMNAIMSFADDNRMVTTFVPTGGMEDKNENVFLVLFVANLTSQTNGTAFIVVEDDFFPRSNFMAEMARTLSVLPDDWRTLHLCPGFVWDRIDRPPLRGDYIPFIPERPIPDVPVDTSGRVFITDAATLEKHRIWLGGPIAFVIRAESVQEFLHHYNQVKPPHRHRDLPSDVALVRVFLKNRDFIAARPILCRENETGKVKK